jgi:hypothetical protein
MSFSTVVEWLNENSLRSYPLVEGSPRTIMSGQVSLDLHSLILDASLFYDIAPDEVKLVSVQTSGSTLTIQVTGQANFVLANYNTTSYPQYVRNTNHSLLVLGDATGIPTNLTFQANALFELSATTEVYPNTKGLSSLTIDGTTLTGNISLSDGYQCSLIPSGNTLQIEVGKGEGQPLPCVSIKGVTNDCDDVVSSLNGVTPTSTGGILKIVAGNHVKVIDDPDNNRIFIGFDFVDGQFEAAISGSNVSSYVDYYSQRYGSS